MSGSERRLGAEIEFYNWELRDSRLIAELVADVCGVALPVAEAAVRDAMLEGWHCTAIKFRRTDIAKVSWWGNDGDDRRWFEVVRLPHQRREPARLARADDERLSRRVRGRPAYEQAVVIAALLLPASERQRRVDESFDHLACAREDSVARPARVALSIVIRGLLPIAARARFDRLRRVASADR